MSSSPLLRHLLGIGCAAAVVIGGIAAVAAQDTPRSGILAEYTQANTAFAKKDYAAAIAHFTKALALAPSHPGLMAELARAEFLAGKRAAALERLTRAVTLGSGLDVVDDPVMAPLMAGEDAARARAAAAALREPHFTDQVAFRLQERDLIPEGIAYDPVDRRFYVSSIYRRKIVRIDPDGQVATFVPERRDGVLAVLGLKVDATRRVLWAATEGTLTMKDAAPGDDGRAALMQYDLKSGALLKRFEPAGDPGRHLFNDIAIDREGRVFVTDSEAGSVYTAAPGSDRLERLVGPGVFEYANGIVLSSDERRLFVAHIGGIGVVDLATRAVSPLPHPEGVTLADIDGLARQGHALVAVQNGLAPARIAVFTLTESEDRVTAVRVLERGHPLFASIPTTGAIADGWFYFIANAQLRAFTPDHRILPLDKLQETVILKTKL